MEKPILVSTEMVRAIQEGRKTQTRRVIKLPGKIGGLKMENITADDKDCIAFVEHFNPYGQPGDHLWVRETWQGNRQRVAYRADMMSYGIADTFNWITGESEENAKIFPSIVPQWKTIKWRPSIHMPRWASRITLEVTGVRVERVQEITPEDCEEEGIESPFDVDDADWTAQSVWDMQMKGKFQKLWDSINAKRGYSWAANPWVWVIEFKKVEQR